MSGARLTAQRKVLSTHDGMDITEAQLGWIMGCALLLACYSDGRRFQRLSRCYASSECSAAFTGT